MKTMSYYYTPIRMAKSPNTDNINAWWEYEATRTHSWWGCKMVQLFWKTLWQLLLQNWTYSYHTNPGIMVHVYLPKEVENLRSHKCLHMYVDSSFTYICLKLGNNQDVLQSVNANRRILIVEWHVYAQLLSQSGPLQPYRLCPPGPLLCP